MDPDGQTSPPTIEASQNHDAAKSTPDPKDPTPLMIKKTVLESHGYNIRTLIGSGTFAKVMLAYSVNFNRPVAIKIISKSRAPPEYLRKFLPREIEVVKRLRHENIIMYYENIETTHRVYIIMQFAEKGSLLDLIRKERFLDEIRARKYFRQLISVIEYCHSKGVVHRDIKCENLLFDRNYNIKLIDFGFARGNMKPNGNGQTLSQTYCGSYAYASPEVLKGIPYKPQYSDIWSSGVVLYAMVFGVLPFLASNYAQLLKQTQEKVVFYLEPVVSDECKYLIGSILTPVSSRMAIELIKMDPWFRAEQLPSASTSSDLRSYLKEIQRDSEE